MPRSVAQEIKTAAQKATVGSNVTHVGAVTHMILAGEK